jgi:hypothetical protein
MNKVYVAVNYMSGNMIAASFDLAKLKKITEHVVESEYTGNFSWNTSYFDHTMHELMCDTDDTLVCIEEVDLV